MYNNKPIIEIVQVTAENYHTIKNTDLYGKPLSKQEIAIFELIMKGLDIKSVGAELGISYNTTRNHLSSIYQKCNIGGLNELMAAYISHIKNEYTIPSEIIRL